MRHEKAETIHRIALDMRGTAEGLSLYDIQTRYSDKRLSRRTAERLRDAVDRLFSIEHANPGEVPKRWRLRGGVHGVLTDVTADDLADLATAAAVLRREHMAGHARSVEKVAAKLRAQLKPSAALRLEPDFEALTEAEGLAMRPGPAPRLNAAVMADLRKAILASRKVRLYYRYRGSGKRGFQTVHPYGFLYGNRHYLVAWSESPRADDFRNFALSNVERVEILKETFARKKDFSLARYSERSFGVFQEEPFEVLWRFDKKVADLAREFQFHPTQKLTTQKDGSLLVSFMAGGALEMAWHLYTWRKHVKVIKPKGFWKRVSDAAVWAVPQT